MNSTLGDDGRVGPAGASTVLLAKALATLVNSNLANLGDGGGVGPAPAMRDGDVLPVRDIENMLFSTCFL